MQSSHAAASVAPRSDDRNPVAYGGLEPVVRLAERCGLPALTDETAQLRKPARWTGHAFDTWRYCAACTDSPLSLKDAERDHRRHAVVEQVIADIKNSAFAHAPSVAAGP